MHGNSHLNCPAYIWLNQEEYRGQMCFKSSCKMHTQILPQTMCPHPEVMNSSRKTWTTADVEEFISCKSSGSIGAAYGQRKGRGLASEPLGSSAPMGALGASRLRTRLLSFFLRRWSSWIFWARSSFSIGISVVQLQGSAQTFWSWAKAPKSCRETRNAHEFADSFLPKYSKRCIDNCWLIRKK